MAYISEDDLNGVANFRGSFSGYERNAFFLNMGPGKPFVEAGHGWGLDLEDDGRAVAPLDFDGDGDQDLVMLSLQGLRLLRNESPSAPDGTQNAWIRVRLKATQTEAHALGALVVVETDQGKQMDRVDITRGFHTQIDPTLHFGLGAAKSATVEVRWPSGKVERHTALKPGRLHLITEGAAEPTSEAVPAWPAGSGPRAKSKFSLDLMARTLEGDNKPLGRKGLPLVVNFWAPWCEACKTEAPALSAIASGTMGRVHFVGVSAETKDLKSIQDFMGKYELVMEQRLANDELVASFFGSAGEMPLPATFVFDESGTLRRAFYREVSKQDIVSVLNRMERRPAPDDLLALAARADEAKRPREAVGLLQQLSVRPDVDSMLRIIIAKAHFRAGRLLLAEAELNVVLNATPKDLAALAFKAAVLGAQGKINEAATIAEEVLKLDPDNAEAHNNLGMIKQSRGDRAGAIAAFEAAIMLDPELKTARRNLEQLGQPVDAPPR